MHILFVNCFVQLKGRAKKRRKGEVILGSSRREDGSPAESLSGRTKMKLRPGAVNPRCRGCRVVPCIVALRQDRVGISLC